MAYHLLRREKAQVYLKKVLARAKKDEVNLSITDQYAILNN